jgi:hypothetical protein
MSKLAFCMTDCGLTTISKKDIKFITADLNLVEEVRKYQKLIEFNEINGDLQYSFSHKIFQDYLSAQAFKNIKSKDELNYLFASDLILYNWEPVVPFIVELLPKDYKNYLIEQIKNSKPESLINILPEFMVYEKQKEIFIFIFEYYSTNWKFIPGYINLRNLSRIWNTPERENYLLNYIRKPENNNYMTITAFVILSYATNFNKPEIDKTLIECMMREDLKSYRKNLNYIATNYIDIDNLPFETLKKLYKASKNDTVQLLTKYDPDFYYLDDMLDLYKELSEQNKQNQETSELLCFIKDYYLNCCKSSHFNEFVNGFIKKDMLKYNYNYSFDLMKDIVNIAIDGSKEEKIYENMYRLFLYFCESQSLVDDIVTLSTYFQSIGKGYELVERIFKENKQGYYAYLLITLFQEDDNFVRRICKELFPSLDNDTKTNLVKLLAIYQVNPLYEELLNEYSELFMETRKNNILARKTARFQRDMEIILNLDLLIEDLNSIFGLAEVLTKEEYYKKDILTFSELIHNLLSDYFRKNSKANREEMEQQLKHKYEELVLNFVDSHFVQKLPITEENKENIPKLTPELKVWLQNWAKESIEKVDIKNASNYITDNDKKIKKLWNFGKADFIQIPNQIWLDFITLINDSDWEVIEKKVADKSLLKNRVLENLQNKREMLPNIIMNHISFCVRNKCSEVLPHIYEIMENWENDYNKKMSLLYSCLNALINLDIDENWFNAYVLKCPENIVFYLANYFAGYKKTMPGLIERIKKEIQDKKCEYYRKYIYYLCCFGDKDALPLYIEIIKEEKKFVYDPEHINPLEEYTNKAYLEPLLDLLDFSFANNIEQSPYISLIVSVLTNLEIIALTDDMLNIVVEKLNCYKDKYKDHPEIYRIHFSISRIKTEFQRQYINSKKLNDALAKYNELQQK